MAAFAGEWDGFSGLVCIGNFHQPDVVLGKGDLVASAQRVEPPAAEPLAHVWRDEDEVQTIQEVDMPPAEYYEFLKQWRREQHPHADPHLLDHLACWSLSSIFVLLAALALALRRAATRSPSIGSSSLESWLVVLAAKPPITT